MNGVILFLSNFQECLEFYKSKIRIPIMMQKDGIVRFSLGSMYLQIEDAVLFSVPESKGVIIRTNVESIITVREDLRSRGVDLEVHDLEWGEIGFVFDPSGTKFEYFREK